MLIVDQLVLRRVDAGVLAYRPTAFAGWILGAAAATASHYLMPGSVDALVGIVAAAAGYAALEAARQYAGQRAARTEAA